MKIYEKPSMIVELLVAEETLANDSYLGDIDPLGEYGDEISIPAPDGEYWQ